MDDLTGVEEGKLANQPNNYGFEKINMPQRIE
jgi:hypothetical protein